MKQEHSCTITAAHETGDNGMIMTVMEKTKYLYQQISCYNGRQIKNDQPGLHDFRRFLRQF